MRGMTELSGLELRRTVLGALGYQLVVDWPIRGRLSRGDEGESQQAMSERRYGNWAGKPNGYPEDKTRCVNSILGTYSWIPKQCSRRRGHGPNGEY